MTSNDIRRDYRGATFALVTQHGKAHALAPILRERLDVDLVVVDDVDTDQLGTFTRDVPRAGTQLETARRKARLAIERGHAFGLGSEGAFLPGPFGTGAHDVELLVFVDAARDLEIVGRAIEPGWHVHGVVGSLAEAVEVARRAGFPEHGLVVRPDDEDGPRIRKGLRTERELHEAFFAAQREARSGRVFVENDLRAHQNPTRMATIAKAAVDLVERLACSCPTCGSPGFGFIGRTLGLPCRWCGSPTNEPLADDYACVRCDHRESRARTGDALADPGRCDFCNP